MAGAGTEGGQVIRKFTSALAVLLMATAVGFAQDTPAGAHSVDDHSHEEAVNAQIEAAETAIEHGDYAGAEAKLKLLAAARPKDGRVLYDLGYAQERNAEPDDAAKSYAAAIEADGTLAQPHLALGLLNAREGQVEAAHSELAAAASLAGASLELRGRALRAMARLDEKAAPDQARDELLAAIKLTGETPEDVALSAEMAVDVGDPADAEAAFSRALKMTPGDVDAAAGLAHTLEQQKKLPEAEAVLNDALKLHPDDPRLVSQLVTVYVAEDKATQAVPLLEALRAKSPAYANDPVLTRLQARVYEMSGDHANAEKLYQQLAQATPGDPSLLDDLGSVLIQEQKYSQAENIFARAVSFRAAFHDDAAWGVAASHLAYAASKAGHPQVTLQALDARATVLPDTPSVLFLRAISYDGLHQRKQAIEAYRAFLAAAAGKFPDEEFEARHRLIALEHEH
jgi:Flp pilus assembly protein TadD